LAPAVGVLVASRRALAAGAALGFVTAAAAVSYAGAPPAAGYCWYYTNP
jgi:hypothetical protein